MSSAPADAFTVFPAGDVMTGRGIDQALAHPSSPELQRRRLRLERPAPEALRWLRQLLDDAGRPLGSRLRGHPAGGWQLALPGAG